MRTTTIRWIRRLLVIAIVLSSAAEAPQIARAQTDVQLWTDGGIRYQVSRRLRLDAAFLARFDQNISRGRLFGPEASFSYKLAKWIRIGAGYRFERRRIGGSLRTAHRINFDLRLRRKVGQVVLGYRLRFQERIRDRRSGNSDVRGSIRNRLGIDIDTDTLVTPGMTIEFFTGIHGRRSAGLQKMRLTFGAEFDLERVTLGAFYRVQIPIDRTGDATLHILGLSFRANFKHHRRRRHQEESPAS